MERIRSGIAGNGVSSEDIFIGNSPMVFSLFVKAPGDRRDTVRFCWHAIPTENPL